MRARALPRRGAAFLFLILVFVLQAGSAPQQKASWENLDRLLEERKLELAAAEAAELRAAAQAAGDEEAWTRALLQEAQIRITLGGFETAARFLLEQPRPKETVHRAAYDIVLAHALRMYTQIYSWEIRRRERVEGGGPGRSPDLKTWTQEELLGTIIAAYLDAWKDREALSEVPVSRLARFLEINNYPPEIRGTLRDSLTYQLAEFLAYSPLWTPRQELELRRLDLASLIAGTTPADLADPGIHPMAKLAAVLGDLEAWHLAEGNRAAALEARLERLRALHARFDRKAERQLIRRDLEERLPALRDIPWWSMGMATLAGFVQESGDPDRLARARAIAAECRDAYPDSPGGKRCRDIVRRIEAPDYHLSGMQSDGLGRRSLRVTHKNLPALFFRAYRIDPLRRIETQGKWPFLEEGQISDFLKRQGKPDAEWRTELPTTPDFEIHTTYVAPPIQRPGAYIVVASARQDFAVRGNKRVSTSLVLGDLVLLNRTGRSGEPETLVLSGSTGRPVSGVEVRSYRVDWRNPPQRQQTGTTGEDGVVRLNPADRERWVVAHKGDEVALLQGGGYSGPEPAQPGYRAALIYTDHAIYRPGQKILWKALVYQGHQEAGKLSLVPRLPIRMTLFDLNGQEVARASVTTNEFGTAAGEIEIPPGRPLGSWSLRTSAPGGWANVLVEEYKRPTFEVTLEDLAEPPALGRPATFTGRARYYFGLPVTNGKVAWHVTREPVFPWIWMSRGRQPRFRGATQAVTLASGTAEVSADGTFQVTFTPEEDAEAEEDADEVTYRYKVHAEVTDEGGETRDAERFFRLGRVAVEARIEPAASFLTAGRPSKVAVTRSDLDGVPRSGEGSWELFELRQPERALLPADQPVETAEEKGYKTEGDLLRPREEAGYHPDEVLRIWEDGARLGGGALRHDERGKAEIALPDLPAGAYRLRYTTADASGARYETALELIVAGDETPLALPLVLKVDAAEVRVGGTVRLLAHSGLPDQILFLETYRSGRLIERRTLESGRDPSVLEIPVRREDQGGLGFRLLALRDHQLMDLTAAVFVPWSDRELDVSFSSFRDKVKPGGRETWTVTVRTPEGEGAEPAAAEVLAYMTDRSLDLFAKQDPPRPIDLFPNRIQVPWMAASLGGSGSLQEDRQGWDVAREAEELRGDRLRLPPRARREAAEGAVSGAVQEEAAMTSADLAVAQVAPTPAPAPPPPPPAADPASVEARRNFSETAFWEPHLLTGPDGSAAIEFTVPDSVTSWNVWVHALTRDLRSGSLHRQTESVKDLMVRPYLPRFLREGDRAELKVVVNNASGSEIRGQLTFDILDPETDESLLADFGLERGTASRPFTVAAGGGTSLTFPVTAPRRTGPVAFRVVAQAGDVSDGELRPLPVLPSRIHLAQSRFVTLKGQDRREMTFEDLAKNGDPTRIHDQMVVTVDGQLFESALQALPYLVDYPYECTEQTLNRFISTGILTSLFDKYPAIARMAEGFAKRETRYEVFPGGRADDPNRKMALEETPWLQVSRGRDRSVDPEKDPELIRILDPRIARAQRDAAYAQLAKAQLPSGAFPWWPGGPPSEYMTLYILYSFSKASEFGVEVPAAMVEKAWRYIGEELRARDADLGKCCRKTLVFLNYVASAYSDPRWAGKVLTPEVRKRILDTTFRDWQELSSPYLRSLLALTLHRMGRPQDARLVFDSVMDDAKTTPEEGTFWMPEERAWLWFNDTVEGHAFSLRTLMELRPDDPRAEGLVQWLFLNKKLGHWKSTRATAEALYALAHYLKKKELLGKGETVAVRIGGRAADELAFEPDRFTGTRHIVVPGEEVGSAASAIVVEKETPGLVFASATWHFSTEQLPAEARGDLFGVTRRYFRRTMKDDEPVLQPLGGGDVLHPGDQVEVHLSIRSRAPAEYVHLRDPRPAGLEPESVRSGYRWELGLSWYEETRDSGANFFFEALPAGEHTLKYRLRANTAGTFRAGPATLQSMYAPEFNAYSADQEIRVEE